jgi:hypothetical protein
MPNFKQRFEQLCALLAAHPRVELYSSIVNPPAAPEDIKRAEEAIGQPLHSSLREFYEAHNGVFLEWGLKGHEYAAKTAPFSGPDYGQPPGCINLLPIAEAMSPSWEANSFVNQVTREHQVRLFGAAPEQRPPVGVVVIDNFAMYNHGDLVFGPEPAVIVSTDHGADIDASDFMSFSTYLDLVLAVFGTNRYQAVGTNGSRESKRLDAWTKHLALDEVLAQVQQDAKQRDS